MDSCSSSTAPAISSSDACTNTPTTSSLRRSSALIASAVSGSQRRGLPAQWLSPIAHAPGLVRVLDPRDPAELDLHGANRLAEWIRDDRSSMRNRGRAAGARIPRIVVGRAPPPRRFASYGRLRVEDSDDRARAAGREE